MVWAVSNEDRRDLGKFFYRSVFSGRAQGVLYYERSTKALVRKLQRETSLCRSLVMGHLLLFLRISTCRNVWRGAIHLHLPSPTSSQPHSGIHSIAPCYKSGVKTTSYRRKPEQHPYRNISQPHSTRKVTSYRFQHAPCSTVLRGRGDRVSCRGMHHAGGKEFFSRLQCIVSRLESTPLRTTSLFIQNSAAPLSNCSKRQYPSNRLHHSIACSLMKRY
ncbi:hypothetical protein EDB86DRAFT_135834 [Lactarius hatsudake]|nr:hypothetical protein EDB86DRAFT_135834 [Lactarius hatsudake]